MKMGSDISLGVASPSPPGIPSTHTPASAGDMEGQDADKGSGGSPQSSAPSPEPMEIV